MPNSRKSFHYIFLQFLPVRENTRAKERGVRGASRAGSLLIGSESAKPTSYHPTPRVLTPGVGHFYALFRDISHPSADNLCLSLAPVRAVKLLPESLHFPDAVPLFGRKLSSALPRRGDHEFTNPVDRHAPTRKGKTRHAWSCAIRRFRRRPPSRNRSSEATQGQRMHKMVSYPRLFPKTPNCSTTLPGKPAIA